MFCESMSLSSHKESTVKAVLLAALLLIFIVLVAPWLLVMSWKMAEIAMKVVLE